MRDIKGYLQRKNDAKSQRKNKRSITILRKPRMKRHEDFLVQGMPARLGNVLKVCKRSQYLGGVLLGE
jgi:hypothetical protein